MSPKGLDELLTRQPAPVDSNLQNTALYRAYLRDPLLHVRAQPIDSSLRKANGRQFALHRLTHLCEGDRVRALGRVGARKLSEQLAYARKNCEAVVRELFQTGLVCLRRILLLGTAAFVDKLIALFVGLLLIAVIAIIPIGGVRGELSRIR